MEPAGAVFEHMSKDTARLSGIDWVQVTAADGGRDRLKDIGTQTVNGLSVRNLMTLIGFAKAMALFRGADAVGLEDVRQILPFVLRDKLRPDLDAPFFGLPEIRPPFPVRRRLSFRARRHSSRLGISTKSERLVSPRFARRGCIVQRPARVDAYETEYGIEEAWIGWLDRIVAIIAYVDALDRVIMVGAHWSKRRWADTRH
jgi:hypothetical protein